MKKIIFILVIFNLVFYASLILKNSETYSGNLNLPSLIRLTNGVNDRNPSCGVVNSQFYGVNGKDWSFLVFERIFGTSSNIIVTKIGTVGPLDTGYYLTNNSFINKNPCITHNTPQYPANPTKALAVWETNKNGSWDIYASRYNIASGWSAPFSIDSSLTNKTNARVSYFDSTFIAIVYQNRISIRFKRYNYETNSITFDTNLTIPELQNCSNPNVMACNSFSYKNICITYEKEITAGRKAVYYTLGNIANNIITWSTPDTIAYTGSNRNSEFIEGYYSGAICYFESNRTGDWNVYKTRLDFSNGTKTLVPVITNNGFDDYSYAGSDLPLGIKNEVHSFYGYLRKSPANIKAVIREAIFGSGGDSMIVNIGNDTNYKSKLIRTTIYWESCVRGWVIFNKDSLGAGIQSGIYGTYYTGCPMNIENNGTVVNYSLFQNYPNPFNAKSNIKYQISKISDVQIKIFDILGREIAILVNEKLNPGTYEVTFDGSNLPSGVYFYKLSAGNFTETKKLTLLK
ncbi:MAG TPA: T9SS type A sorting domain-containing protein [Ignavibacteria bacterium]